jgi:hypothetical protein
MISGENLFEEGGSDTRNLRVLNSVSSLCVALPNPTWNKRRQKIKGNRCVPSSWVVFVGTVEERVRGGEEPTSGPLIAEVEVGEEANIIEERGEEERLSAAVGRMGWGTMSGTWSCRGVVGEGWGSGATGKVEEVGRGGGELKG